ncbi:hypothetical protein CTA2_6588, partial [Colletotrichum tanaceti]
MQRHVQRVEGPVHFGRQLDGDVLVPDRRGRPHEGRELPVEGVDDPEDDVAAPRVLGADDLLRHVSVDTLDDADAQRLADLCVRQPLSLSHSLYNTKESFVCSWGSKGHTHMLICRQSHVQTLKIHGRQGQGLDREDRIRVEPGQVRQQGHGPGGVLGPRGRRGVRAAAHHKGLAEGQDEQVLGVPQARGGRLGRRVLVQLAHLAQEGRLVDEVEDGAEVELGRVEEEHGVVHRREVRDVGALGGAERRPVHPEGALVREVPRVRGGLGDAFPEEGEDAPAEGPRRRRAHVPWEMTLSKGGSR